ncbi:MAG: hypothetical protein V3R94_01470 [Acidobacteriota bacterium]
MGSRVRPSSGGDEVCPLVRIKHWFWSEISCLSRGQRGPFIFVYDHPFFATVTPEDSSVNSRFEIEGIPEGTYTLVAARDLEGRGVLQKRKQEVTLTAGKTTSVTVEF